MFERYTEARNPRQRRRLAWILSVSFVGHMTAATALLVAGMWQINKLMPPERSVVLQVAPRLAKSPEPAPMRRIKPVPRKKIERHKRLRELVQPDQNAPDRDPEDDVEYAPLEEIPDHGFGDGDPDDNGATGYSKGDLFGDGIVLDDGNHIKPLPPPREPPRVIDVSQKFLEGRRISGNAWILPPESVRASMHRYYIRKIQGMVKMCLDPTGRVKNLRTLRTIGYEAYDRKLLREMRHWRYRPYQVNGTPIGMCTVITFIYKVTDR